jgi:hypothetical protein
MVEDSCVNPLIGGYGNDTIDRCRAVLTWMSICRDDEGGGDFGRSLVLDVINGALEHAQEQYQVQFRKYVRRADAQGTNETGSGRPAGD